MVEGTELDVESAEDAAERRDEVVARVTDHAGRIARELAVLQGGDYGQRAFATDAGEWTLKYEAGAIQYLRFDPRSGEAVYVVSTKRPPDPEALARAMADYGAFVEAYNAHIASLSGVLDDVDVEFPTPVSTESVAAERDRVLDAIREVCDEMAAQLHRYDGTDYGTFGTRVSGSRWELKREGSVASYLRVGGEGGIYLLSQYGPPSAPDVRNLVDDFPAFVEAYNDEVRELEGGLSAISVRIEG
ncbi:hypothetical protein [Halalkalicoccus ordinarius]|uniref:hypothetical protein n=1 Tax=Halalkalicoccus ordinarius TaxID=3116651 RepID=UPI00300EBEF9